MKRLVLVVAALAAGAAPGANKDANKDADKNEEKTLTTALVMEAAQPSDWRRPDPANLLYLDFAAGRVIIELAPRFAPEHVANLKALVRRNFFDGLPVGRVQDNYVTQWGDIDEARVEQATKRKLPDETVFPWSDATPFIKLPDADGYAPETGWIDGFPAGVDRKPPGAAWMTHCYGTVGVGRGDWPDTGDDTQLYAVTGQAPRHLDRNIVLLGRVLRGMELLSALPRGSGPLGFYTDEEKPKRPMIQRASIASDVPEAERSAIEVLRTDTPLFTKYLETRRNRRESWFVRPAGHIDVCNLPIPVR